MFGLFKKKKNSSELFSVCDGTFKNLVDVNDTVFAEKIMGDGFAVTPESGKVSVYSPIKGKVLSIFPTKHAITFETDNGVEGLIHMGLDTVALKGEGFNVFVEVGDKIDQDTIIAEMDTDFMKAQSKEVDIIVVITNLDSKKRIEFAKDLGELKAKDEIGSVIIDKA